MSYETEREITNKRLETAERRSDDRRSAERSEQARPQRAKRRRRRKKSGGLVGGIIAFVLIALIGLLGIEAMSALSEAKGMLADIDRMKAELRTAADCALSGDSDGALGALDQIDALAQRDRETLAGPLYRMGGIVVSDAGADLKTADSLLTLVQRGTALARQGLGQLPVLTEETASTTDKLSRALSLFDSLSPELLSLSNEFVQTPDFRLKQLKGRLTPYQSLIGSAAQLLPVLQEGSALLQPLMRQVDAIGLPDKESLGDVTAFAAQGLELLNLYDSASPELIDWTGRLEASLSQIDGEARESLAPLQSDLHRAASLLPLGQRASATLRPILQQLAEDSQRSGDPVSALLGSVRELRAAAPQLSAMLDELEDALRFETPQLAGKAEELRGWIALGRAALAQLTELPDSLIVDLSQTVQAYPFSTLKTGEGYNLKLVEAYFNVYQNHKAEISALLERLGTLDLGQLPPELQEKISSKLVQIRDIQARSERYVPLINTLLNKTDYANYLLVAQNTAELRACGGFPGNLTMITVRGGWLNFDGIGRIYDILPFVYPDAIQPSLLIKELFGSYCQMQIRDASFNPHWPFVASVWAYGFENDFYHGDHLDGILSCTPKLVQELVALTGDIQLFNGSTLNGENTLRYLMHDVYFQYHTREERPAGNEDMVFDAVFDSLMERIFDDISIDWASGMLDLLDRCAAERVIMLWMADENDEAIVRDAGLSGALNFDPNKPQIGVYFSVQDSNKVGYYVDLKSTLGEGTANADGSMTWPVTVVVGSVMTEEDIERAKGNDYKLMGTYDNNILSSIYFTSPALGSISEPEYEVSYARPTHIYDFPGLLTSQYEGLTFKFHRAFFLEPGESITFRFTVTTAPGVTAVPTFSQTPTCTGERGE